LHSAGGPAFAVSGRSKASRLPGAEDVPATIKSPGPERRRRGRHSLERVGVDDNGFGGGVLDDVANFARMQLSVNRHGDVAAAERPHEDGGIKEPVLHEDGHPVARREAE
jgi:hypothetical protein